MADFPVSWLRGHEGHAAADAVLHRATAEDIASTWDAAHADRLIERLHPDGSPGLVVTRDCDGRYLVHAEGHGRYLLSADGAEIACDLPDGPTWAWHRLLFAQVLPLAATLKGLELLHASAVVSGGRAVAFSGVAGAGKSSIAAHLVAAGATYLTDDALAIEAGRDRVLVNPGAGIVNIHGHELTAVQARGWIGEQVVSADKALVAVDGESGAVPLAALCFLERRAEAVEPTLQRLPAPDPTLLIGATFVPHVRDGDRLLRQLDACERLAALVPCFRVSMPREVTAESTAAAVASHLALDACRGSA